MHTFVDRLAFVIGQARRMLMPADAMPFLIGLTSVFVLFSIVLLWASISAR